MPTIINRFRNAWDAFKSREPTPIDYGPSDTRRPDKYYLMHGNNRSIVTMVYNRIAVDAAALNIRHARVDSNGKFADTIQSALNNALTVSANFDQTGRNLIQDAVMSMFDEGCVAIVPTLTTKDPLLTDSYDIGELRVGQIVEWRPKHVKVNVYNENTGRHQEIMLPKHMVAIVENPFYSIMNEPNSTLQQLVRTLYQIEKLNNQTTSGKMDLIIQLPYVVKGTTKTEQAKERLANIEHQLSGSKYGIAYIDGTEKITQLNRSIDNQLWQQAQDLTAMLFNQLGLTQGVFDGTADEQTMLNYYTHTIEPIMTAIVEEMTRKFLSKTAISQRQSIVFFRDPFKLVPDSQIADIADKLTRNEIASSNEMRAVIGWKPSEDPRANELRNKNLNQEADTVPIMAATDGDSPQDAARVANGKSIIERLLQQTNKEEKNQNGV